MMRPATVLPVLLAALPLNAHDGVISIAVPGRDIVVDGDFSDWPTEAHVFPLDTRGGGEVRPAPDFRATYRMAYDSERQALYVAVDIDGLSARHGVLVNACRIDLTSHADGESDETWRSVWSGEGDHDETTRQAAPVARRKTGFLAGDSLAVWAPGDRRRYEWQLSLASTLVATGSLAGSPVITVAVGVGGLNEDGTWSYVGTGGGGDVILGVASEQAGWLEGEVRRPSGELATNVPVRIRSSAGDGLSLVTRSGEDGRFRAQLPHGDYAVEAINGAARASLRRGERATAIIDGLGPHGTRTPAGPGTSTAVRSGLRNGPWLTLGPSAGMPVGWVPAIFDGVGDEVWIGTGAGVTRYDGASFVTYGEADGMPPGGVRAGSLGPGGHLWLGTLGGVARYDGESFVVFGEKDGLLDDSVVTLLHDREGDLWIGTARGLSRYDGSSFFNLTAADGLAGDVVTALMQAEGDGLWIATTDGVSRYESGVLTTHLLGEKVNCLATDTDGRVLAGSESGVVHAFDGQQWRELARIEGALVDLSGLEVDAAGNLWVIASPDRVRRWTGVGWDEFTVEDGLPNAWIISSHVDREGRLWFGGLQGGVARFDDQHTRTFTTRDGLASNLVFTLMEDRKGRILVGDNIGTVARVAGDRVEVVLDGIGSSIHAVYEDDAGHLWAGTRYDGVVCHDGADTTWYRPDDGLPYRTISAVHQDRGGDLWLATGLFFRLGAGVIRYDGETFEAFTVADGLAGDIVNCIAEDAGGHLWFGTDAGVSRYDGSTFRNFTAADGLADDHVLEIVPAPDGGLWFATRKGASHYDGLEWTTVVLPEHLDMEYVMRLALDRRGHLWLGAWGHGVVRTDGRVFQSLFRVDGVNPAVQDILEASDGTMWIATEGGVTRYRPRETPPMVRITGITTDRRYDVVELVQLSSAQDLLQIDVEGASMDTPRDRMAFVHRLEGYDDDWRVSYTPTIDYTDLPVGDYTFEVKAVDRGLNYSEPAELPIVVHLPYTDLAMQGGLAVAVVALALVSGGMIRRRRERDQAREQLLQEQEAELNDARRLQMGLMPTSPPQVEGLQVAGECRTANHVGGDLFQYFRDGNVLRVALADVTGHAMEAAIPVVMFSGVLDREMEDPGELSERFGHLNRSLVRSLGERRYVCFTMAEIDVVSGELRLASCGCPYPLHYRADDDSIRELQVDAYPLGVRADTTYDVIEAQLAAGDYLILYSDGIPETVDRDDGMFGFEATASAVLDACRRQATAEELIERVMAAARVFAGRARQEDDMTCVVVRVTST